MEETPGKVAYDAYLECAGGVSLVSGEKLPSFEALRQEIREAWEAAAEAVRNRYGAIY